MEPEIQTVREEVVGDNRSGVEAAVRVALGKRMLAARILSGGLIAAMTEVGGEI